MYVLLAMVLACSAGALIRLGFGAGGLAGTIRRAAGRLRLSSGESRLGEVDAEDADGEVGVQRGGACEEKGRDDGADRDRVDPHQGRSVIFPRGCFLSPD